MKKEIYQNGPISCGMHLTDDLVLNYKGGIYNSTETGQLNHEVSIVGYGVDQESRKEYWVVRNTFGTSWGDMGFFYIEIGKNNLGIETECIAGIPTFQNPSTEFIFTQ